MSTTRNTWRERSIDIHIPGLQLDVVWNSCLGMRIYLIAFNLLLILWGTDAETFDVKHLNGTEADRFVTYINTLRQWVTPTAAKMPFVVSSIYIFAIHASVHTEPFSTCFIKVKSHGKLIATLNVSPRGLLGKTPNLNTRGGWIWKWKVFPFAITLSALLARKWSKEIHWCQNRAQEKAGSKSK